MGPFVWAVLASTLLLIGMDAGNASPNSTFVPSQQGLIAEAADPLTLHSSNDSYQILLTPTRVSFDAFDVEAALMGPTGSRHLAVSGMPQAVLDDGRVITLDQEAGMSSRNVRIYDATGLVQSVTPLHSPTDPTVSEDERLFACRTPEGVFTLDLRTLAAHILPSADVFGPGPDGTLASVSYATGELVAYRGDLVIRRVSLKTLPRKVAFSPDGRFVFLLSPATLHRLDLTQGTIANLYSAPDGARLRDLLVDGMSVLLGASRREGGRSGGALVRLSFDGRLLATWRTSWRSTPQSKASAVTSGSIPWPLSPDEQHGIGNTWGEYQSGYLTQYLHPGIDILGTAGQEAFSVADGVVKAVLTTGGTNYWRVAIADSATADACKGYLYAHLDPSTIAVSVGDTVTAGQYLGDLVSWPTANFHHVHFARIQDSGLTWDGEWLAVENPHLAVSQSETSSPAFEPARGADLLAFCENETSNYQDPDSLHGAVDIIAHLGDTVASSWLCAVQEIRYTIYPQAHPGYPLVSNRQSVYFNMSLDQYAGAHNDSLLLQILYKHDSTCPSQGDFNGREFYHIITNSNGNQVYDASDLAECWDTSLLPDEAYVIRVTARDVRGNSTSDSMVVHTANGNPATAAISTNLPSYGCWVECPKGDRSTPYRVTVDFDDAEMHRNIASHELALEKGPGTGYVFWDSVYADSAATASNGYTTTLTQREISGCGEDSTTVLLDGVPIGKAYFKVHTPDFLPASPGIVNGSDLSAFAEVLSTCVDSTGYNPCMDIDPVGSLNCVTGSDLSMLAAHLGHYEPGYLSKPIQAGPTVSFAAEPVQDGRLQVGVELGPVGDLAVLGLILRPRPDALDYVGWQQDPACAARTYAFQFLDEAGPKVVLLVLKAKAQDAALLRLGTLEFAASEDARVADDLEIEFAEGAGNDGRPWGVARSDKSAGPQVSTELVDRLEPSGPNPFDPSTTIRYSIAQPGHVQLAIYNIQGRLVRRLVDADQERNAYRVVWDGRDEQGRPVSNGIYFSRLTAGDFKQARKLVLVRR